MSNDPISIPNPAGKSRQQEVNGRNNNLNLKKKAGMTRRYAI